MTHRDDLPKPGSEDAPERAATAAQAENSQRALAMKQSGETPPSHPAAVDTPNEGVISTPRPDHPSSGAFDAEGHRPVLERSRKVR